MSTISTWSTTAASNTSEFPEGQAPSTLNNGGRDVQAAIRLQHENACWIDLGQTPTRTADLQFTVVGDQTADYTVGRRVKFTDATSKYGTITVSAYTTLTTVTIVMDSGVLVSPTAVALGILDSNMKTYLSLDEDDMSSDSATNNATQQSIKAYVDSGTVVMTNKTLTAPALNESVLTDYGEAVNILGDLGGGTDDIDLEGGNVVTATVSTATQTFTFSNPPASGTAGSLTLILTNGGSQTVNWPASVDWNEGDVPDLTTSGVDVLSFLTVDGGTTWYGFTGGLNFS